MGWCGAAVAAAVIAAQDAEEIHDHEVTVCLMIALVSHSCAWVVRSLFRNFSFYPLEFKQ